MAMIQSTTTQFLTNSWKGTLSLLSSLCPCCMWALTLPQFEVNLNGDYNSHELFISLPSNKRQLENNDQIVIFQRIFFLLLKCSSKPSLQWELVTLGRDSLLVQHEIHWPPSWDLLYISPSTHSWPALHSSVTTELQECY